MQKNKVFSTFIFQLGALLVILLSWAVQFEIIFPLEQTLFPAEIVEVVSLLFLPFGIKIIFAVLTGTIAIVPIFLAHVLTNLYLDKAIDAVFIGAFVGLAIIYLPIALINFVTERPLMRALDLRDSNINIFRVVLALAIVASILNAMIHTVIFQGAQIDWLAFRFVVGDIGGTLFVLLLLVTLKQPLIRMMNSLSVGVFKA